MHGELNTRKHGDNERTQKGSEKNPKQNTWEDENTDYTRLLMDEENETTRRNTNNEISTWIVKVID